MPEENGRTFKSAMIGRFDNLKTVGFRVGDTINDLLTRADISLGSDEEVNDENGVIVTLGSPAKETKYYCVTNYKNGSN